MDDEILLESPEITAQNYYAEAVAASVSADPNVASLYRRNGGREIYVTSTAAGTRFTTRTRASSTTNRWGSSLVESTICKETIIEYKAPFTLEGAAGKFLKEITPDVASQLARQNDECIICCCPLIGGKVDGSSQQHSRKAQKKQSRAVRTPCGHIFHRKCILDSIQSSLGNTCP